MRYLLVPRRATADSVEMWVGAVTERRGESWVGRKVELVTNGERVALRDWNALEQCPSFAYATATVRASFAEQEVALVVDGAPAGSVRAAALPRDLSTPFRVLLGSCFEPKASLSNPLARSARLALDGSKPHVKILCGDQVYLDPVGFSVRRRLRSHERNALDVYLRTWNDEGFRELLSNGANFFCPDDHDFWNDYTLERGAAEPEREAAARTLLRAFQGDASLQRFDVDRVRFLIADTRSARTEPTASPARFMTDDALRDVIQWLNDGARPRVLVLGQPLFGERGYDGRFGSDIPQYREQFGKLADAIVHSPGSVVVLSGDLHFGRVAAGRNHNGKTLVEVISSPLGLGRVRSLIGFRRPWRPALETFPGPHAGGGWAISTVDDYRLDRPHFATLDFASKAGSETVTLEVRSWPLEYERKISQGQLIATFDL